tara:strand:- start:182 stop:691 length:510 start_codon:yes stop_codon:yes gene_type:complete
MSSSIDSLRTGGDMNDSDTQLVDSILNDLKQNKPAPEQQYQEQQQQQELTPEQQKMMYMQQQQELEQQQQQMMQQQQQMMQQQNSPETNMIQQFDPDNILNNLKKEGKSILLVILLGLMINLDPINDFIKSSDISFLVNLESKELTIQSLFLKAIVMGVLFYIIKTFII